ncbi:MAG: DNA internalization-related competence protein ComEC/Rec2 [Planctomycetes bacterium]|nr:DNA internalization-related competence protein ComEC/Rec2 [Planctomycetota bacterium]
MALFTLRRSRAAAAVLLIGFVAAGGARHHAAWSTAASDDVSLFLAETARPVRLTARVVSAPEVRLPSADSMRSAWPRPPITTCVLSCRSIHTANGRVETSGRARLRVSGILDAVEVGDEVEVRGWIGPPPGPQNPGEFDYRKYLRRQGIRSVVYAGHPAAVTRVGSATGLWIDRPLARLRERWRGDLEATLDERTAGIAAALLLGDRTEMTDQVRDSFAESGMMHVLAVSGLHVGILAVLVWFVCRSADAPIVATSLIVIGVTVLYALIAGGRPPVVRAAVVVTVWMAGRPWYRQAPPLNVLAAAVLVVLAWRPTDLFDTGAQLSFLAVGGILWWHSLAPRRRNSVALPEGAFASARRRLVSAIASGYGLSAAIWVLTAPVIASSFQLVSPVGLVINVLLIPLVTLVLWAGFAFLVASIVLPPVAGILALVVDVGLGWLLGVVDAASSLDLGHRYVSGPAAWWLAGFYAALVLTLLPRTLMPALTPLRRGVVVGVWVVAGLGMGFSDVRPSGLRCTVLSVGHGLAVLVEFPNGRTLLVDTGALDDGRRAAKVVRGALLDYGRSHIDAVVITHADLDHFNGVPDLVDEVPVGTVCVARSFLDLRQSEVERVCETVVRSDIPLRFVARGDRLPLDDAALVRVLHPPEDERFESDNANSVVLSIEYAGRRLLLCGDLEEDGLDAFLSAPPTPADVLLAPHHGSRAANTPELAAWARPRFVVASRGRTTAPVDLAAVYGPSAHVYSTDRDGAVTILIAADGRLTCEPYTGRAASRE